MDPAEMETWGKRHSRTGAMVWWSFVFVALGVGYVVGAVWALLAGAIVTVALIAVGVRLKLWWDRACWLKQFPELADNPDVKPIRRTW
jgi:hypothetical protein